MHLHLAALLLALVGTIVQITALDPERVVEYSDQVYLYGISNHFKSLFEKERVFGMNQHAVLIYDIDRSPDYLKCKAQTYGQVFLVEPMTHFSRSFCPFFAAKETTNNFLTEEIIFFTVHFCPRGNKVYLYSYESPCVRCDDIIHTYAEMCASEQFFTHYRLLEGKR